jgi:hypothetical protein
MSSVAACRNTITARALEVRHGTTRRFAEHRLPVTIIRRWWLMTRTGFAVLARFNTSRSG